MGRDISVTIQRTQQHFCHDKIQKTSFSVLNGNISLVTH